MAIYCASRSQEATYIYLVVRLFLFTFSLILKSKHHPLSITLDCLWY